MQITVTMTEFKRYLGKSDWKITAEKLPRFSLPGSRVGGKEFTSPSVFSAVVMAQSTGNMEIKDARIRAM